MFIILCSTHLGSTVSQLLEVGSEKGGPPLRPQRLFPSHLYSVRHKRTPLQTSTEQDTKTDILSFEPLQRRMQLVRTHGTPLTWMPREFFRKSDSGIALGKLTTTTTTNNNNHTEHYDYKLLLLPLFLC